MTGDWRIDWPTLSISLFNTILLFWLALTIFLNAERRDWGVWLVIGGLGAGALFFISHTAILGIGYDWFAIESDFWWRVGWPPLIIIPYSFYIAMLWFIGYWDSSNQPLRKTHQPWFRATSIFAVILFVTLVFGQAVPSFTQVASYGRVADVIVTGPALAVIFLFPVFIVLCISLSIFALRSPTSGAREQFPQARDRARPWLILSALILLLISLLAGGAIFWVVIYSDGFARSILEIGSLTAKLDLIISGLISIAILSIGQAMVAYEIFTGATLPRQGLLRGWRRVIIVAVGYSTLIGGAYAFDVRPIYSLLMTALFDDRIPGAAPVAFVF